MKERKRLPYLPLFIDDWMQSSGVCDCSDSTRGIYVDLLCVLFKEKVRGTYSLHSKEMKWRYSRSKTQLALAKRTMSERLPYFVDFLIKPLRSNRSAILKALQELLFHEVIIIIDDILIQPRMYRDYGGKMLDDDTMDERLALPETGGYGNSEKCNDDNGKKNIQKSNKKSSQKNAKKTTEKSRARASRDRARTPNGSGSVINISDDNGNIGGTGDFCIEDNSKQSIRRKNIKKTEKAAPVADNPPSLDEICAYFAERAAQGKPLEYITAEEFYATCETDGWTRGKDRKPIMNWKTYAITCNQWRQNHGDKPKNNLNNERTTTNNRNYSAASQREVSGQHPTDTELVEQSARIMQELRSEGEQSAGDEVF